MLVVKNKKWNYPSLVDHFLNRDLSQFIGSDVESMMPTVNIIENDAEFQIELAAPGLQKEDLQIDIEKEVISISADKKSESEQKNGNYLKREFSYHRFKRSFNLPENINTSAIHAKYENGVLKVVLPKVEKNPQKEKQTIVIS